MMNKKLVILITFFSSLFFFWVFLPLGWVTCFELIKTNKQGTWVSFFLLKYLLPFPSLSLIFPSSMYFLFFFFLSLHFDQCGCLKLYFRLASKVCHGMLCKDSTRSQGKTDDISFQGFIKMKKKPDFQFFGLCIMVLGSTPYVSSITANGSVYHVVHLATKF